jgi:hypothetical protein
MERAMSRNLTYTFEEAPLFIDCGYQVGLISGEAEISYDLDGQWSVASISLEGYRGPRDRKMVEVCRDSHRTIFTALLDHLEGPECKQSIQSAVDAEIEAAYDDEGLRIPTHAGLLYA